MKELFKVSHVAIGAVWFFLGNFMESLNIDKWISLGAIAFFAILALISYRWENRSKKLDSYDLFDFLYTWYGFLIVMLVIMPLLLVGVSFMIGFLFWCLSSLLDPNTVPLSEFLKSK